MSSTSEWIAQLGRFLAPDQILSGPAAMRGYDCDAYTVDRSSPVIVCLPSSTDQVAELVRWCVQNDVPYTARGAGTGLSGGALPALGGLVISTKKLTRILEVDVVNRRVHVQAGVVNQRISDAVYEHGLHFAPDPSSQTVSTIGGNIAENAGGPHTLKYGVTRRHVLSVTMVNVDGEVVELGHRTESAPGPDFLSLIVGGEGTLGIVTEAWVLVTPVPTAVQTALICFAEVRQATTSVAEIVGSGAVPAALEMMDRGIMNAVEVAFNLAYPAGAQALLLVECDGSGVGAAARVEKEMDLVREVSLRNQAITFELAADPDARARLWMVRKKSVGAMGRLAPSIVTHDGVIPRSRLPEMLDFVYEVARERHLGIANMFHAGDGNLHPCFYFDDRDPAQVSAVVEAGEMIARKCVELGGSITGEHGVGVEKLDLMSIMFTEEDLKLQALSKRIFNEGNLCNPCKVLPNQKSCVEHKKRWRGAAW